MNLHDKALLAFYNSNAIYDEDVCNELNYFFKSNNLKLEAHASSSYSDREIHYIKIYKSGVEVGKFENYPKLNPFNKVLEYV